MNQLEFSGCEEHLPPFPVFVYLHELEPREL